MFKDFQCGVVDYDSKLIKSGKNSLSSTMKIYMLYHRNLVLPTEKYYVYIHRNPLTHKIFYVGSAKGNPLRAYEFGKHRNQSWKNEVISFGGTCNIIVEIVQYCEDPIQAQEAEFRLIYKLKNVEKHIVVMKEIRLLRENIQNCSTIYSSEVHI